MIYRAVKITWVGKNSGGFLPRTGRKTIEPLIAEYAIGENQHLFLYSLWLLLRKFTSRQTGAYNYPLIFS